MSCSSVIALMSRSAWLPPSTVLNAIYASNPLWAAHRAILALHVVIRVSFSLASNLALSTKVADPHSPDEWLSVADIAAELGMHPSTVRKWANEGVLRGTRIGRRQWRFRRSALQDLEQQHIPVSTDASAGSRTAGSLDPLALTSDADLVEPA
jgi:excisionase family DNA binding protein